MPRVYLDRIGGFMMQQQDPSATPILSEFASDSEMLELIQSFVDEMPDRISELEAAWRSEDAETLERVAHQLKGASAGYGFAIVGEAAAELEATMKAIDNDLEAASNEFKQLVDLCSRAAI